MPLLITGAGLVGSQIASIVVKHGERPVILDRDFQDAAVNRIVDVSCLEIVKGDVLDYEQLQDLVRKFHIERIIHTVANPLLTVGALEKPLDAVRLNIVGTANVLEVARKESISRVIFTSSSVLYIHLRGGFEVGKMAEDNFPRPTTIYASTKLACENLGLNYSETYGFEFIALRLAPVFGPWIGKGGGGGPSAMFRQLVEMSLKGEDSLMTKCPSEFVYSKDAANAAVLAAEPKRRFNSKVFNVSMGRAYTRTQIAGIVKSRIPSARIEIEGEESDQLPLMDITRSRKELGYEPSYDMGSAIDDYVGWYRDNR
ncbi:MAG: NAD-dependent epimerase/dehydratase family protein [Nitrososphaerales archaeon]